MRRSLSDLLPAAVGAPAFSRDGRGASLTRRQKRLLVAGRLSEAGATDMSDRAIARELGVSQPFVSAIRRKGRLTSPEAQPPSAGPECHRPTSAQQWLDRNHDDWSALGRVRRVAWPAPREGAADRDGDPF